MPLPSDHSSLKIHEVMHPGVIDCPPQTSVSEVVSLMAEHGVHCVVVDPAVGRPVGVISSLDVARALAWGVRPSNTVAEHDRAGEPAEAR